MILYFLQLIKIKFFNAAIENNPSYGFGTSKVSISNGIDVKIILIMW